MRMTHNDGTILELNVCLENDSQHFLKIMYWKEFNLLRIRRKQRKSLTILELLGVAGLLVLFKYNLCGVQDFVLKVLHVVSNIFDKNL